MPESLNWLLSSSSWIKYRTLTDLLEKPENDAEVRSVRQAMLVDPQIQSLVSELFEWPGPPLLRHNDATHLLHKLVFIADLGFRSTDPGIDRVLHQVLKHQSVEGAFQVLANAPRAFGGTGKDTLAWMLCDCPSILYALVRLGLSEDHRVQAAAQHLAGLGTENGWLCTVSPEMGKFRGPGKKTDPCPYATLISLKALAQLPAWRDSLVCHNGAETLLKLWEQRKERKPYLFAMGTDFRKLKAPFIWYDILHILSVLTQFPWLRQDQRLREMLDIVNSKANQSEYFTPESVWKAWLDWDFGQKKAPSPWMTLQVSCINKRMQS